MIRHITNLNILNIVIVKNKVANPNNIAIPIDSAVIVIANPIIVVITVPTAGTAIHFPILYTHFSFLPYATNDIIVKNIIAPMPIPNPIHNAATIPGINVIYALYPEYSFEMQQKFLKKVNEQ